MRLIEFRGKRTDNGQWVYGDLIQTKADPEGKIVFWIKERTRLGLGAVSTATNEFKEVQPETVGQYTEKTDTQGNKVFENDRVKFGDWNDREGIVTTKDGIWTIDDQKGCIYCLYTVKNLHVIGTVHDEEDEK